MDNKAFLTTAFQTADWPFLPAKVAAADAPLVNVLPSPETPWHGKPRDIEYSEIINQIKK
jgi:hypothetical protein